LSAEENWFNQNYLINQQIENGSISLSSRFFGVIRFLIICVKGFVADIADVVRSVRIKGEIANRSNQAVNSKSNHREKYISQSS
jgi:hypothetical protein